MTDADLIRCIEVLDKRKTKAEAGAMKGTKKLTTHVASLDTSPDRSSSETSKIVGANRGKVEKARTILDHADEETKQEVLSGNKTINNHPFYPFHIFHNKPEPL